MKSFYPVPEWYSQNTAILVWPHRYSDWASTLDSIEHTYLLLARAITAKQPLLIIYFDHQHKELIRDQCTEFGCDLQAISFEEIETNDTWVRDYGPLFLVGNKSFQYLDFEFNAWGEQYPYRQDNLFAETLFECVDTNIYEYSRLPLVLEGGNVDFDDNATLLTNLSCIQRNNVKSKLKNEELITYLKEALSVKKVLGLQVPPLAGDDTGGHIDTLARFISNEVIAYASTSNLDDPNFECLNILHTQLTQFTTRKGTPYNLLPIPMPKNKKLTADGEILPASYINFVFINGAMLVPLYNDDHDAQALFEYRKACPNHEIIGIDASELIKQFGSLHCATSHIPAQVLNESRPSTT